MEFAKGAVSVAWQIAHDVVVTPGNEDVGNRVAVNRADVNARGIEAGYDGVGISENPFSIGVDADAVAAALHTDQFIITVAIEVVVTKLADVDVVGVDHLPLQSGGGGRLLLDPEDAAEVVCHGDVEQSIAVEVGHVEVLIAARAGAFGCAPRLVEDVVDVAADFQR